MSGPKRQVTIRFSPHEKSLIDRALKQQGIPLQTWARNILISTAEGDLVDPAAKSRVHRLTLANSIMTRKILEDIMADRGKADEVASIATQVSSFVDELQTNGGF